MHLFVIQLFKDPILYFTTILAFMGSICIHEFSHATVAHWFGDDTAAKGGFRTLNPFKVMGWMSIACLLLFGFSWGAVPVMPDDPNRLRRSAVALAGPLSNFLFLLLSALLLRLQLPASAAFGILRLFFIMLLYANSFLFLFNILPVPVLDGWRAVEPFLPRVLVPKPEMQGRIFLIFIYLACFSGVSGLFDKGLDRFREKFTPQSFSAASLVAEGDEQFEAGEFEKAFKAYSEAAGMGSVEGRINMAMCLAEGHGCKPDPERAFAELSSEEVAKQPMVRCLLAGMLTGGVGCKKDPGRAYQLLLDREVQEIPEARGHLGMMLVLGLGTERDDAKAFQLLDDKEVLQAFPFARGCLAQLLLEGEVCEKDEKRAFSLLDDPEVYGSASAFRSLLGVCHYAGLGTEQDFKKAAGHLRAAADAGYADAMDVLGYENGRMPDYGMPIEEFLRQCWLANQ